MANISSFMVTLDPVKCRISSEDRAPMRMILLIEMIDLGSEEGGYNLTQALNYIL
jgi:hypothetical protein